MPEGRWNHVGKGTEAGKTRVLGRTCTLSVVVGGQGVYLGGLRYVAGEARRPNHEGPRGLEFITRLETGQGPSQGGGR